MILLARHSSCAVVVGVQGTSVDGLSRYPKLMRAGIVWSEGLMDELSRARLCCWERTRGVKGGGRYYDLALRGHNSELYQNTALISIN